MILLPVQEPLLKLTTLNDRRPHYRDVCFAVLFVLLNVAAFGMQITFITKGMAFLTWYNCVEAYGLALPISVVSDGVAGVLRNGGGQILGLAIATCFIFSVLWIYSLRTCAKPIVWATYILGWFGVLGFIFYVKDKLSIGFASAGFITPLVFLAISGVVICYRQESINRAARVMSTACRALGESPCLFVFTFLLQLLQLLYFGFYMFSAVNAYMAYDVLSAQPAIFYGNEQCGYVDRVLVEDSVRYFSPPRDWVYIGAYFSSLVFLWNVFFGDAMRLFVTTGAMGEWFFNSEERHRSSCGTVGRFFKWALTVQLGTLAVSALVSTAIQKLKQWAKIDGCCCCCPHVWISRIILCAIQSCVSSLTRFNLSYAAISGDGFVSSVKNSFTIVFQQFGDAATNELTAAVVLNFGTLIFSCAVGLLAWAATAFQLGRGVFVFEDILICDNPSDTFCSTFNTVIHSIMFGFSGWVAYNTLLGFFLLIMFPAIWTFTLGQCVYMGVLSMLVARLIFTFVGGLIQDATTGMFMCAAIDKQNGTISPKRHYIDEVMKEEKLPVAWYTVVAVAPASAVSVYSTPVQIYNPPLNFPQPPPPPPPVAYQPTFQQTHQQHYHHQQGYPPQQQGYPPQQQGYPQPHGYSHQQYQHQFPTPSPYHVPSPQTPYQGAPSQYRPSSPQQYQQPSYPPSRTPSAPASLDAPPPYMPDAADYTYTCKSCQATVPDDAKFCVKCGSSR